MIKNIIAILFAVFILSGCTNTVVKYKYITVEVPVPVEVTPPPVIKEPTLPIASLSVKDKGYYPKIAKAYVTSIVRLKEYINKLNTALDKYRPSVEGK